MEKGNAFAATVPGLQSTLDKLSEKDNEFLVSTRATLAVQQEDLTVGTPIDISKMHGFSIRTSRMKLGHNGDFVEYTKLLQEGYKKANIDPHIGVYSVTAGVPVPTYMSFRAFRSLAEMDEWAAQGNAMRAALTQEQRDRMDKLVE